MTMVIADEQGLRTVGDLRERLLQAIVPGARTVLDLGGVTGADLAFVQLIESARRHAAAHGAVLSLAGPAPAPVIEVLERAGFGSAIPFWTQASA